MGGPCAARAAHVSVVARAAEAPQVFNCAGAREAQFWCLQPNVCEREVADVAPGVSIGGQRGTAFDRSVGLNAHRVLTGVATRPVDALVAAAAPHRLIWAKVADVVAGLY